MFFVTYLWRELRRRMRQAIFVALGLALGVGLVITVTAVSAGVSDAQKDVLHGLYGIGTDVTVTVPPEEPTGAPGPGQSGGGGNRVRMGPGGATINGEPAAGQTLEVLRAEVHAAIDAATVQTIAEVPGVTAAAGGLTLTNQRLSFPEDPNDFTPETTSFDVNGVDVAHTNVGPYSSGMIASGRTFEAGDAEADVAVVDSNYATANGLAAGSTLTVAETEFEVIGIVEQPQGSNPPSVHIPLGRAQALGRSNGDSLDSKVNTIYVTATSAADIATVAQAIKEAVPSVTVNTASSLADQISGSLKNTATLANLLGRWLSILVLVAAFVMASLLTMAAVARRVREFGTLKALGWRTRRIIGQVMGESVTLGIVGGIVGVGLGVGGAALVAAMAPELTATVETEGNTSTVMRMGPGAPQPAADTATATVTVPLSAPVSVDSVLLALALAVAGGLIAGAFASWRIARLRPAAALARVA